MTWEEEEEQAEECVDDGVCGECGLELDAHCECQCMCHTLV